MISTISKFVLFKQMITKFPLSRTRK